MNKRNSYLAAAALLASTGIASISGIAGLITAARAQSQPSASPSASQPSALVRVQTLQLRQLHASITAYGDVQPGQMHSISSVAPAQISRLEVVLGQTVRKGQVLAVLQADPGVQLSYAQAQTAHTLATAELQRVTAMAQLNLATQSQLDTASKAQADALAAIEAQRALGGARSGQTIVAPADGVVMTLGAFQGDRVQPGVPFMQIGATGSLKIALGIDPADLAAVRQGMRVNLTPLNAPDDPAHAVSSSVQQVQQMVDPKTQLASIVVQLQTPAAGAFTPGTRVRGEIALAPQSAYEVPRQAVLSDARGSYVFQVAGQVAHRIAVRQVIDRGSMVGIIDTDGNTATPGKLDASLPLVVEGNYELSDGMPVRVIR